MNGSGFTKLFSSIVTSSVWVEDDKTLRVWIAMLATANAKGFVAGAIPGFASLCRISVEEMERSVGILSSPDPYSRTKDNDGRRITACEGGWLILNHHAYRNRGQDKSGSRAAYMRDYRKGKSEDVTCNTGALHVRTEAEAEVNTKTTAASRPNQYSSEFEVAWSSFPKRAGDNPKHKAFKAWSARVVQGEFATVMIEGVKRYGHYCGATGKLGTEYVMQAATFFGPDKRYAERWDIPKPPPKKSPTTGLPSSEGEVLALGKKHKIEARPGESLDAYRTRLAREIDDRERRGVSA